MNLQRVSGSNQSANQPNQLSFLVVLVTIDMGDWEVADVLLGLETFSYHKAFAFGTMNIFSFIERAHSLGLDGVQINVFGATWGHLGSNSRARLRDVRALTEDLGMFVEIDTNGTDPDHLADALGLCEAIGADVLRTYASFGGDLAQELKQASRHLQQVVPICADLGIRIALENHEHETARDILAVVREVGSETVGVLVDTGNSMMVWEDPVEAVRTMAPHAVSTHFKDHVVIVEQGQPLVVGVPIGRRSMDCAECFRVLANSSLERINIEVCYGYSAPFRRPQEQGGGAKLGEGAFRVVQPPFDPSFVAPRSDQTSEAGRKQLLAWHEQAVVDSVAFVKELNRRFC